MKNSEYCFASYVPFVFLGTQKIYFRKLHGDMAEEKGMTSQKAGSLSPTRFSSEMLVN